MSGAPTIATTLQVSTTSMERRPTALQPGVPAAHPDVGHHTVSSMDRRLAARARLAVPMIGHPAQATAVAAPTVGPLPHAVPVTALQYPTPATLAAVQARATTVESLSWRDAANHAVDADPTPLGAATRTVATLPQRPPNPSASAASRAAPLAAHGRGRAAVRSSVAWP